MFKRYSILLNHLSRNMFKKNKRFEKEKKMKLKDLKSSSLPQLIIPEYKHDDCETKTTNTFTFVKKESKTPTNTFTFVRHQDVSSPDKSTQSVPLIKSRIMPKPISSAHSLPKHVTFLPEIRITSQINSKVNSELSSLEEFPSTKLQDIKRNKSKKLRKNLTVKLEKDKRRVNLNF